MTEVEMHGSFEAMIAAIQKRQKAALEGLAPEQARLTWGDHWIRFYKQGAILHAEFGRVSTREEIALRELRANSTWDETVQAVSDATTGQAAGFLTGWAFSEYGEDYGTSHKANVWPIEQRLYTLASDADWNLDRLDEVGLILVEIAFRAHRAYVIGSQQ